VPCEITGRYGSGRVFLKPASQGTGLIAGGSVRAVLQAAGVQDVLTKTIGSHNPHNVLKATIDALQRMRKLQDLHTLRRKSLQEGEEAVLAKQEA
jgi:small subunit ribosomal protein S5